MSPATGQNVDVRVASSAKWGLGQLDGLTMGDLLFEDGAALRLAVAADGTIAPVAVSGSVTCEGVLGIDFERLGALPKTGIWTLLSASGGLTAPTSFVGLSSATRGAVFAADGDNVVADVQRPGLTVVVW